MSDLTVRRYRPTDADAAWDLHERALRAAGAFDPEYAHLDADLRAIADEYLDDGEFLVGVTDGDLVAMGGFQPHPDGAAVVLRRMRVDPDYHRRGFGTRLLHELEARARKRGFDRAELETTAAQTAAVAFYEHHGYELLGREPVAHADTTMLCFEKPL